MNKKTFKQDNRKLKRHTSTKEEIEEKVALTLTEEEVIELQEIFNLFDKDSSGTIDSTEVRAALDNLDLKNRNPMIYEVISCLEDIGGEMDFGVFIEAICDKLGNTSSRNGVNRLFQMYDIEDKGVVQLEDVKRVARELGETMNDDEIMEMMHHVHVLTKTSANGQFTQEDFYQVITKGKTF